MGWAIDNRGDWGAVTPVAKSYSTTNGLLSVKVWTFRPGIVPLAETNIFPILASVPAYSW